MSEVRPWLRLEGAAVFTVALALYATYGAGWLLFAVLFFTPDLAMLGYLAGPRRGAVVYNLGHTYTAPALLAVAGVLSGTGLLLSLALIWAGHIGFDRMLGYGLKLPTGFQDTHLGPIGRRPAAAA